MGHPVQLNATSNLAPTYLFPEADGPPCIDEVGGFETWEVHELENVFQLDYRHAEKAAKGKMINTKLRTRPN